MRFDRLACAVVVGAFGVAGCGVFVTGDDALADEFGRFKANGGVCLSEVPSVVDTPLQDATRFRHLGYSAVLGDVVSDGGFVGYDNLISDPEELSLLDTTLAQMAAIDPSKLPASTDDRLAFWINAYNAIVLRNAARAYAEDAAFRVDDDDFSFFKRKEHTVGGVVYSLNEIENGIIRGDRTHEDLSGLSNEEWAPFQARHDEIWQQKDLDPRVHFLLNCASRSCPVIGKSAWTGASMQADLDARARAFVLDDNRGAGPDGISEIFAVFYFADFDIVGGIDVFISQYRDLSTVNFSETLPYDWSLNRAQP